MAPLWPFPSCDWPPPGDLVVDRPDGSSATHNVAIIDIGDHLDLTQVSPGRVLIDWPGLGLEDVGGPVTGGNYTLAIGSNLALSFPSPGVARLDAAGGGGGTFAVSGGPGFALDIFPCSGIELDAASGLKLEVVDSVFAGVSLYEATPGQAGAVTANPQSWRGMKTLLDGLTVGQPGPVGSLETKLVFSPYSPAGGSYARLELLQVEAHPGGGTDTSGIQVECNGDVARFRGITVGAVSGLIYNRTSLIVTDEFNADQQGIWWGTGPGNTAPWIIAGGLLVGGPFGLPFVSSVGASGGTTGLTFSGGPVTSTGTLLLGGTLAIAAGGTGATTAAAALAGLLPPQAGQGGKALVTSGTAASWGTPLGAYAVPSGGTWGDWGTADTGPWIDAGVWP